MNQFINSHSIVFLSRICIALLTFTLLRIAFIVLNADFFPPVNLMVYVGGFVFDLAAISYIYFPFILASILPVDLRSKLWYQLVLKVLFYISTIVSVLVSLIDLIYYRFTFKRSTADIFDFVTVGNDTARLIPQFIKDYYYIGVLSVIFFILIEYLYRKTQQLQLEKLVWWKSILYFVFWLVFFIIASRGGIQLRPISAMEASNFTSIERLPLVLNTPFTISRTLFKNGLTEVNYFEEQDLELIYNPIQSVKVSNPSKKNVVLLILESFSKEYIGFYNNGKGYTPFMDSLMEQSVVFENAFANGKKSIEALPSLLAGIPNLMESPYATSIYNNNKINGLGTLLKKKGYTSSFYHGGANGTMNFDSFTKIAGFDDYNGRNEYTLKGDYDGNWGIFDEPYLRYTANELSKKNAPFFSAIFTLSSHHPYTIPESHKNLFPKGTLEIHESIGYTDYALKQFFKAATKWEQYDNTVFIITADHTAQISTAEYMNRAGFFRIPLVLVNYTDSLAIISTTVQQSDVFPLILGLANYEDDVLFFGNHPFEDNEHFAVNYINGVYQLIMNDYSYLYDGNETVGLYFLPEDPYQINNLKDSANVNLPLLNSKLKAIIQQYTNRMINNELTIKK